MSDITLTSTTDTQEQVEAALARHHTVIRDESESVTPPEQTAEPPSQPPTEPPAEEQPRPAEEPPAEGEPTEPPKKVSSYQQRINELTRERYETQQRIARLEGQIAVLSTRPAGEGQPPAPPVEAPAISRPKPKLEDFEDLGAFAEAMADWKVEDRLAREAQDRTAREREAQTREAQTALSQRLAAARDRHDDFDAKIQEADAHVRVSDSIASGVTGFLARDPLGPDIAYYLATHREEHQKVAALTDLHEALDALFAIKHTLSAARPSGPATAPVVKPAPTPLKPVGSGPHASVLSLDDIAKRAIASGDHDSYREARKQGQRR